MKNRTKRRLLSLILVAALVIGICPTAFAAGANAIVPPAGQNLIAQTNYVIADGVTQSEIILNGQNGTTSNTQNYCYLTTISPEAQVKMRASYGDYYTAGSTPASRAERAPALPYNMVSTTKQAANYEAATGENVIVATNADYYNMATGQCSGVLIMEGNVIQTKTEPYFALLKDGSYAIRDLDDPNYNAFDQVEEAISGPFMLVKNGANVIGAGNMDLMPRNSVGLKADGTVVLLLVDGRQGSYSVGMTLNDLANFLLQQGCVNAIYLDGGGSATIASKYEGDSALKVRNTPSDGIERVVASAMMFVDTSKPSGVFDHAALTPNNKLYVAGATVAFEATGVDTNGYPVALPSDAKWSLTDDSYGTIGTDGTFKSAGKCGTVTVNLSSGGAVVGSTTIDVQEPDEFFFEADSLNLAFKTTTDLGLKARYNHRDMDLNGAAIDWTLESNTEGVKPEGIGSFANNMFTTVKASQTLNGTITAVYNKQDGSELKDVITIEVGKMPSIAFDFEPDADGNLIKCGEYDWGNAAYDAYFADENTELTYISWNDETNLPDTVTKTGPYRFGGTYIGDNADKTYDPACYILGSAGYSFFTWHTTYMQEHSATAEVVDSSNGEVRFGDHALKLNYDYTNLNPGYRNVNEYLYYSDTSEEAKSDIYAGYEIQGAPTGMGVWIYAPEGTPNFWVWTQIGYYDEATDSYKRGYIHFTTSEGRTIQYTGIYWEGWMYCEADLSAYAQYASPEHPLKILNGMPLILLTFIPGGSANENGDKIPMGDYAKGSLYFDNFRFVYGDTIDDLDNPVVSDVTVNGTPAAQDGTTVVDSSTVTIAAKYSDPEGDNSTGIAAEKTAVFVDGMKIPVENATETEASVTTTLANGSHCIKISVADGFGNVTTDVRYITVSDENSTLGSVTVSGALTGEIGKDYVLSVNAANYSAISSAVISVEMNDTFGEPSVAFKNGFTGSADFADGVLTITMDAAEAAGETAAEITFNVPVNTDRNTQFSYIASGSMVCGEDKLTFAQPKTAAGITAAYSISADVMLAGSSGKIYVTNADGKPVQGASVIEVTADGETVVGKTNKDGILITNRFCRSVGTEFVIYASGADGYSFRYSDFTTTVGEEANVEPWNIRLNATSDASTTESITWFATPQYTAQNAYVDYVTAEAYDSGEYTFTTASGTSVPTSFSDRRTVLLNSVQIEELEPDTTYYYRVGDGQNGHWSELSTFTTSAEGAHTSFFVIADTQMTGNADADAEDIATLDSIGKQVNAAGVDFGIQTGDFVDDAGKYENWNEILDVFSRNYGRIPLVQVLGNHEYYNNTSGAHANAIFDLEDKNFYSVEYGNVYVAVINCNASLEEAAAWLVEDAQNSDCQWKVLTLHQPPYYTNPMGSSAAYNQYIPAAAEAAGIDLVFSGHDHAYARTQPIAGGEVDEDDGVVYFICGDLGEKSRSTSYKAVDNEDFHFAAISQNYDAVYLLVNATTRGIAVTAYNADGTVIDSYEKKNPLPCGGEHQPVYDAAAKTVSCALCLEELENFSGLAKDKNSGKQMYFVNGEYQTGWITIGKDIYHFDKNGLSHKLKVITDQPTTCTTQGFKEVSCECGETFKTMYTRPSGHSWTEATAEDGSTHYVCDNCGETSTVNTPFIDVKDTSWYAKDVEYVYKNGIVSGVSAIKFAPNDTLTRAQLVTILWRAAGEPDKNNNKTSPFVDCKTNTWYTAAINWAAANEITSGIDETHFAPNDFVTREQMVAFLYRYANFCGYDMTASGDLSKYTDAGKVSAYACEPMIWAIDNGIVSGMTDTTLEPKGTSTRAQAAAVIHRLLVAFEETV